MTLVNSTFFVCAISIGFEGGLTRPNSLARLVFCDDISRNAAESLFAALEEAFPRTLAAMKCKLKKSRKKVNGRLSSGPSYAL
jgi:hypothetical protein